MTSELIKFPSTPHLLWLGEKPVRGDKVLSSCEAVEFLSHTVVVEEKVDGANLGISVDEWGSLQVQNRGNWVRPGQNGQFSPLWNWLSSREAELVSVLGEQHLLFGEWCYARHSIWYKHLPDWFLAFDLYCKKSRRFFSAEHRNALVTKLGLSVVPQLARGRFACPDIPKLLGTSKLYDGPAEGIYLRVEDEQWLTHRAKVVSAKFVQQIDNHWSRQPIVANSIGLSLSGS